VRWYHALPFLALNLNFIVSCGNNAQHNTVVAQNGSIFGTVINRENGEPVEGALVIIGGNSVLTNEEGKYLLEDIPFSDNLEVVITATDYKEHRGIISLQQELLAFNVNLVPVVEILSDQVMAVFDALSKDIGSLDPGKIPSIQSYFSKDYTSADDNATLMGVFFGVVPSDYDSVSGTIENIIDQYSRVEFKFTDPDIKFKGDSASMQALFTVVAETGPPDPKQWEIAANGRFDLLRENGDWKITYWQFIPPFIRFVENPI